MFGHRTQEAVRRLENGADRAELELPGVTAAVIDATFEVERGEIFVVMGLSGSGKSTLLRTLNGLLPATAGRVLVDEADLTTMTAAQIRELRQRRMSMVFQHFALFPHRTVAENVEYGLRVQGVDRSHRRTRAAEALHLVGLTGWEDRLPAQLSGGMQQRVGLARALAADTEVLLMDEAFSALDPLIRKEMQDQLLLLQARLGKTIVFITHDLNEAMRLGDRIAMMRDGRIVQVGTAQQILTAPADDYVSNFIRDVDRARVLTAGAAMAYPHTTITPSVEPAGALDIMRRGGEAVLFAVDGAGRLEGTVTEAAAQAAADQGVTDVRGIIERSVQQVGAATLAGELFEAAATSDFPIAVVGESRKLLGVVTRESLLRALAPPPQAATESTGRDIPEVSANA
ncbi:glycine betaine/L-proline ABC transporter ATP-binding protein [Amycolatopsis sp. NPDC051903]|uniref:glycine betaine/L-proline ABC transporter ATP-binding protein n=1 Tax=Amycolatopsis sp. NPDC051903 TaxID=3363936 RepID=UPI0037A59C02